MSPFDATITARQPHVLRVASPAGTTVQLRTFDGVAGGRVARTATMDETGSVDFTLYPLHNTQFTAPREPEPCKEAVFGEASSQVSVRSAVSIQARRNGARSYTFTGRVIPARSGQLLELYRAAPNGADVLTARTRTDISGSWVIDHAFTGTGRFTFTAVTRADRLNASGRSPGRSTVIV